MVKKIESIAEYVRSSHYRDIGVPIVTLIRDYNVEENCFGWKWKTTLYTENDDLSTWTDQFKWFEIPFRNYEFGLTENEMSEIVRQLMEFYDNKPRSAAPNASDFERLIFDSLDGESSDVRFAAGTTMMELGRWKAKRILPYRPPVDIFSSEPDMQKTLLDNLYIKARDAAARMIVFTSKASDGNGTVQTLRFACKEFDYKKFMHLEGDKKNG